MHAIRLITENDAENIPLNELQYFHVNFSLNFFYNESMMMKWSFMIPQNLN